MKFYLFIFIIIFQIKAYSQFGPKELISDDGAFEVITFDLDGDGDQDVLEAGFYGISWYKNIDGQGNFSSQQIISTQYDWDSVYASDLDGDGDLDVIGVALIWLKPVDVSKVAWFENLDGLGNFGPEQQIDYDFTFLISGTVVTADIDNDGDMDIFSGSYNDLFWYENINGLGQFSERHIITENVSRITDVKIDDLDGDGDLDVVASSNQDDKLAWYENIDGLGSFGGQNIIATNIGEISTIYTSDLNGNGYKDVLAITVESREVFWYENTNGNGDFGQQQVIYSLEHRGSKVLARDIDNDGDMDVLSTSFEPPFGLGTISWYENIDGQGLFGAEQIIHQENNFGYTLFASDIDNDNDIDVVGASTSQIAWFENLTPLSIEDNYMLGYTINPNPTNDIININSKNIITNVNIYNQLGQLVLSTPDKSIIDISNFNSGVYYINIIDDRGNIVFKKIIKE